MEKRTLTRRELLGLSATAAAGALLAACAPKVVERTVEKTVEVEKPVVVTATPPAPKETVKLRLTEGSWVGPEGIKFWSEEVIGRFQLENPGIEVAFESAEGSDYADKLYTQAVAGDSPDVVFIWGDINYNLMQKGQLLPIDDYFDEAYLSDFNPANLLAHQLDGHVYGLPKEAQTHALAYNKDMFDAAGLAYPTDTWTWDDYLSAATALAKPTSDPVTTRWGTYILQDYVFHWVKMNGGEWMDKPIFGTKLLIDQPKAVEALKFLYDMIYGPNPVAPKPGSIPDFDWTNVFSTGKVGMVETCSWQVTNYVRENAFRWDFAMVPAARSGVHASPTFASGHSICKSTKHPQEAVKLLDFMSGPWVQKQACIGIIGALPGRKSVLEEWDKNSMGAQSGHNAAAYTKIMPYTVLDPALKDNAKGKELFYPLWEQIWITGELPLEEGLKTICQRINDYFASN